MKQNTFKHRFTKTTYRHRLESEDGPGSLTNIASNTTEEVYEFERDYRENIEDYGKGYKIFTQNGWIGYTYMLEIFNKETQKWDLVGFIPTYEEKDEYYEEDED